MCPGSECIGRPALGPYMAEWGRAQLLSASQPVSPAALRPAKQRERGCSALSELDTSRHPSTSYLSEMGVGYDYFP